ncbi:MAG: segregation/condensation protein A, partial [Clostridia bacterium]|nr:segregation/condensation protein A [Clostridia bacterium]
MAAVEPVFVAHLSGFDGPLDLLLHLIHKEKVRIEDVAVSAVTEQYMVYMASVEEIDMGQATAFLTMAATLLEIKARALLPKPPPVGEDEEDPEEALVRRLREYEQLRQAAVALRELEQSAQTVFTRPPTEISAIFDAA